MREQRDERVNDGNAGLCRCGCGRVTSKATRTDPKRGWVRGEHVQWVRGHNARKAVHYIAEPRGHDTDCWTWQLSKTYNGYGLVRSGDKMVLAHRLYYQDHIGPIPDGKQLDHLCRVRACVRPEHLEPVTPGENCRRGGNSKLTPEAVADIRSSKDTQIVISRRHGISQPQVSVIRSGKSRADQVLPSRTSAGSA